MPTYSEPLLNGFIEHITIADPGSGNNWSHLLVANRVYELIHVKWVLVTDATSINRFIFFEILEGSTLLYRTALDTAVVASTTAQIFGAQGNNGIVTPAAGQYALALPIRATYPGNFIIRSNVLNLQAGDTISAIELVLRTWIAQIV